MPIDIVAIRASALRLLAIAAEVKNKDSRRDIVAEAVAIVMLCGKEDNPDDYPVCRASLDCPVCGHAKELGTLLCWRCFRGFKALNAERGSNDDLEGARTALDIFEKSPNRIAIYEATKGKPDGES